MNNLNFNFYRLTVFFLDAFAAEAQWLEHVPSVNVTWDGFLTLCYLLVEFVLLNSALRGFFPWKLRYSLLTKNQNSSSEVSKFFFFFFNYCLFVFWDEVLGSIPAFRRWRQDWIAKFFFYFFNCCFCYVLLCFLFSSFLAYYPERKGFIRLFHLWIASRNKQVSLETLDAFRFVNFILCGIFGRHTLYFTTEIWMCLQCRAPCRGHLTKSFFWQIIRRPVCGIWLKVALPCKVRLVVSWTPLQGLLSWRMYT